jgi:exoenzyme U
MTIERANKGLFHKTFKQRNKAKKKKINSTASTRIFGKDINKSKVYHSQKAHDNKSSSNSNNPSLKSLDDTIDTDIYNRIVNITDNTTSNQIDTSINNQISNNNLDSLESSHTQDIADDPILKDFVTLSIENGTVVENLKSTVVNNAGSRNISIFETTDGSYELHLDRPPIKRLVLSGGGEKGLSYAGTTKSLEQVGALNKIESCFGSSAGALQACVIAIGGTAEEVKKYSDEINTNKLLKQENDFYDKTNIPLIEDKPVSKLSIIRAIWDTIVRLYKKHNSVGVRYEAYINHVIAKILLARIQDNDLLLEPDLQDIIEKLKKQEKDPRDLTNTINFNDLDRLSKRIPQIKDLTVTGTANIGGKHQLVLFNKDNFSETPISHAVRVSSSLPLVFPAVSQKNFLNTNEDIQLIDGGCIMNTPDPGIIHQTFDNDLKKDESLILVFNTKTNIKKTASTGDKFAKVPTTMLKAEGRRLRADYASQMLEVPISTYIGKKRVSLSTISFFTTKEKVNAIQQESERKATEYLNARTSKQQQYKFTNLKNLLNSLSDTELEEIEQAAPGTCNDIIQMRKLAYETIDNIKKQIDKYDDENNIPKDEKINAIIDELATLNQQVQNETEFINWFSFIINDSNDLKLNRFLDLTRNNLKPNNNSFIVFNTIHNERARREHRNSIFYVIREHIYPVLYGSNISKKNKQFIITAIDDLLKSSTPHETKDIMENLHQNYKAKNKNQDVFKIDYLNTYLKL